MGQELDSLADLVRCISSPHSSRVSPTFHPPHIVVPTADGRQVSFGVAPATAAFALGLRTPLDTLLLAFFVLCGLTRLARFNVTVSSLPKDSTGKSKYFEGFPIPTSLGIVLGMAIATYYGKVEGANEGIVGGVLGGEVSMGGMGSGTGPGWAAWHPITLVFVGWGCAMVSRSIHIPKP